MDGNRPIDRTWGLTMNLYLPLDCQPRLHFRYDKQSGTKQSKDKQIRTEQNRTVQISRMNSEREEKKTESPLPPRAHRLQRYSRETDRRDQIEHYRYNRSRPWFQTSFFSSYRWFYSPRQMVNGLGSVYGDSKCVTWADGNRTLGERDPGQRVRPPVV